MKSLKISFAAVVAVVAIGLTMAAQAGAFESKATFAVSDCFIPSPTQALQIKDAPSCPATVESITLASQCSAVEANDAVILAFKNSFIPIADVPDACPGGQFFCCFTVKVGTACSNPLLDLGAASTQRYLVNEVECKQTAN